MIIGTFLGNAQRNYYGNRAPGKLDPSRQPENAVVWYYPVGDSSVSSWVGGIIGNVGPSISTPIFCQDKLIVAGYHGIRLYQFDSDGNFRLLDTLGPACEATPVVHDGRIYIASRNGYLYCLGDAEEAVDY